MYGSVESLYCTPETNVTLHVNYTGIKNLKKLLYIQTMNYHSAIKRNELLIHTQTLIKIPLMQHFGKHKTIGTESRSVVAKSWGKTEGTDCKGPQGKQARSWAMKMF